MPRRIPVTPSLHYYSGKPITEIKVLVENGMILFVDQNGKEIDTPTGDWKTLNKMSDDEIICYCRDWINWDINQPLPDACKVHGLNTQ